MDADADRTNGDGVDVDDTAVDSAVLVAGNSGPSFVSISAPVALADNMPTCCASFGPRQGGGTCPDGADADSTDVHGRSASATV